MSNNAKVRLPDRVMPKESVVRRGTWTFRSGIHPHDHKEYSQNRGIEPASVPDKVAVLLSQHIGAVCTAEVSKGDTVEKGQVVGSSEAFVSAPVHSPVHGKVKDISLVSHPVLGRETAVIIETDKDADNSQPLVNGNFGADFSPDNFDSDRILSAVRDAGIVGMGGAGFPTRVKLEPNPKSPKKVIIINGCECEPFITCDYRLMLEWSYQLIAGIKLVCKATDCFKVRIAVEDNKPKAIEAMSRALGQCKSHAGIEIVPVKTKYPQGGERQLIQAVTGMTVPTGGIPPMIGVVVLNVATCAAIADAVVMNRPLTHRVVSVTGSAVVTPSNLWAPVGTSIGYLIEQCGGLKEKAQKVISGGPMTGFAVADLETPISKTTGSITILTKDEITRHKLDKRRTACIRCGRCLDACPERLNPTKIAHAVNNDMLDVAQDYYMSACIECGCCSYVCPANIELTGHIKTGKILLARQKNRMPK